MFKHLSYGQKWLVAVFIASLLTMAATFFLSENARMFAYIIISTGTALFAVMIRKTPDSQP